jgi:hypothetical protein
MIKKGNITLVFLISIFYTSCATIFNLPDEHLTVITDTPARISVNNFHSDTSSESSNLYVPRSSNPLKLTVTNSQSTRNYNIRPRNSFAYWLNLYPSTMWLGFLVDMHNPKRYSYPRTVYINTNEASNSYLTYIPLDSATAKRKSIIKFTPFRIVALSNPGVELSYERKTGNQFSTEFMATYLLPSNILETGSYNPDARGYRIGVEEKFYLNKSAPLGPYLAIGMNHLHTHYNEIASFGPEGINSRDSNLESYSDSILIYKRTTDFNFLFGYQDISNRISFDFYCGLGIRHKDVVHKNRVNPNDVMVMPIDLNFNYISNIDGRFQTVILLLGIKIGWIF